MGDCHPLDCPHATLLGLPAQAMHGSDLCDELLYVASGDDSAKRALLTSLFDTATLSEKFPSLKSGVDYIGACFREGRRESLPDAPSSSLEDVMSGGWTVQLHQPQRFEEFDSLYRLVAALEAELGTLVGVNAYVTPKSSQGLAPHWDDVNVIVIQTKGVKNWDVWACQQRPNVPSGDMDGDALGDPTWQIFMRPGDVLYLPRGFIHRAIAEDEDTGHLTLSYGQGTDVIDVIMKTIEAATMLLPFQLRLPDSLKQMANMKQPVSAAHIAESLRDLADHVEEHPDLVQNGMNALRHDFMTSRLPPHPAQLPPTKDVPGAEDEIELLADFHCALRDVPGSQLAVTRRGTDGREVHISFQGSDEELRVMSSIHNPRDSHMMAMGGCDDDDCGGCDDAACGAHRHDHGDVEHEGEDSDDVSNENSVDGDKEEDGQDDDDDNDDSEDDDSEDDEDLGPGMVILGPSVLQLFDAENHRLPATALTLQISKTLCELGICKVIKKKDSKNHKKPRQK